jgi:hypothetical protein
MKPQGYWQKTIREGDRVTTNYLGRGELGAGLAEVDMILRGRREAERLAAEVAEDRARRLFALEAARGAATRRAVAVILEPMGFRRYARGAWRKRAMRSIEGPPGKPPAARHVAALVRRVRGGDEDALAELAGLARLHPRAVAEATSNDLVRIARTMLGEALSARDKAARLGLQARLNVIEAELAPPSAGTATRLLAAVVSQCWGEFWSIDAACSKVLGTTAPGDLRRQHAALRRYLAAVRSYAQVERIEGRGRS